MPRGERDCHRGIANVVVLGISEREGIGITFFDFLKLGFLVMGITVAVGLGVLWVMFVL